MEAVEENSRRGPAGALRVLTTREFGNGRDGEMVVRSTVPSVIVGQQ